MPHSLAQQRPSERAPRLPRPLSLPLALIPTYFHSGFLAGILNRIMADLVASGEFDFLEQRVVCIRVEDASIKFSLKLSDGRFRPCDESEPADVVISSTVYNFLILATRQEDADTLFFQRRLKLEGDIELGLAVKNQLDAMDWDSISLPLPLRKAAEKGASLIDVLRKLRA